MSDFTGTFGANQAIFFNLTRDSNNATLPILLRNQPTLPSAPTRPIRSFHPRHNSVNMFIPNLQMPYTHPTRSAGSASGARHRVRLRYSAAGHRQDWDTVT